MSDLKYKSISELREARDASVAHISTLTSRLNGAKQRLEWIDKYIFQKTVQEMSIPEIEAHLGHRIIIKEK